MTEPLSREEKDRARRQVMSTEEAAAFVARVEELERENERLREHIARLMRRLCGLPSSPAEGTEE